MKDSQLTFFFSFFLYALTLVLGVTIARLHLFVAKVGAYAPTLALAQSRGLVITIVLIVAFLFLIRVIHSKHVTLSLMLLVILAVGTHYVVAAFQFPSGTFAITLLIVSAATIIPTVFTHDLGMVFGIAGVSAILGATMTPAVAILIMMVMAIYDFRTVARGDAVKYGKQMIESGAVFGFIIPRHISGFFQRRDKALQGGTVLLLGSLDIGLPLLLTSAVANEPLISAIFISVGALDGLLIAHLLLFRTRKNAYVAAIPPISSTSIFGYLMKMVLGF